MTSFLWINVFQTEANYQNDTIIIKTWTSVSLYREAGIVNYYSYNDQLHLNRFPSSQSYYSWESKKQRKINTTNIWMIHRFWLAENVCGKENTIEIYFFFSINHVSIAATFSYWKSKKKEKQTTCRPLSGRKYKACG